MATSPLQTKRTSATTTDTHSGRLVHHRKTTGQSAGLKTQLGRVWSSHALTDDQAGRRRLANAEEGRGWCVHTAQNTPSKNATARPNRTTLYAEGGAGQGRCEGGRGQDKPQQPHRARSHGKAASSTVSAGAGPGTNAAQTRHKRPEEVFPQESRRVATELSRPDKPAHSNSRLWQQQIFHVVPPMFPGRRSPGSGSRSEKQGA